MKSILLSVLLISSFAINVVAQQTSPRAITKKVGAKVENRNEQTRAALKEGEPARPPVAAEPPARPQSSSASVTATPAPARPTAPVVREKSKEEKDATLKKMIAFQKQRAMSGQASAQYDYGMRFLNGDGVEKDSDEGRKWIEKAAAQKYSMAVKKLEELDKSK